MLNLKSGDSKYLIGGLISLADVGTLSLEFCTLSKLTKNEKYCKKAVKILKELRYLSEDGLAPVYLENLNKNQLKIKGEKAKYSLGGLSDSYYEYLLKMWIMTNKTVSSFRDSYDKSVKGAKKHLIVEGLEQRLFLVDTTNKSEHLVLFFKFYFYIFFLFFEIRCVLLVECFLWEPKLQQILTKKILN